MMTFKQANDLYMERTLLAPEVWADEYAATVGRFQEGFLKDKVCKDVDSAFARAVEAVEKFVSIYRARAAQAAARAAFKGQK